MKASAAAEYGDVVVKMAARHAYVDDVVDVLKMPPKTTRAVLRHLVRAKRIRLVGERLEVDRG